MFEQTSIFFVVASNMKVVFFKRHSELFPASDSVQQFEASSVMFSGEEAAAPRPSSAPALRLVFVLMNEFGLIKVFLPEIPLNRLVCVQCSASLHTDGSLNF